MEEEWQAAPSSTTYASGASSSSAGCPNAVFLYPSPELRSVIRLWGLLAARNFQYSFPSVLWQKRPPNDEGPFYPISPFFLLYCESSFMCFSHWNTLDMDSTDMVYSSKKNRCNGVVQGHTAPMRTWPLILHRLQYAVLHAPCIITV